MALRLNNLDPAQKLIITQYDREEGSTINEIEAALPDAFGISVGSVFTDPFNANVTNDSTAEKAAAFLNVSRKIGARVTSVFYSGPEPTEMSIELEFNAFYSAVEEVVVPCMSLMLMAVGRQYDYRKLKGQFTGAVGNYVDRYIQVIEESNQSGFAEEVGLIVGPSPVRVKFGKTLYLDAAYIATASPSFSNVLDNQFMPMSATCAITVKIQRNPVYDEIRKMFGRT